MARLYTYDKKYIPMVDAYLAECKDEEREFHRTRGENSNGYERVLKVNLPKIEAFSAYIGVPLSTLYDWEKQEPELSEALEKIRKAQHNRLVDESLAGNYNSTIAKLMLSSNHGYSDKTQNVDDEGNTVAPVLVKFINEKGADNRDTD